MRIEYQLTPDDWAAFGEHCARTAAEFQRFMHRGRAWGIVLCLGAAIVLGLRSDFAIWVAVGLVAAIVWAWYWPRHVIAHVRQHAREHDRPCLRGRHLMEVVPEGLHAECEITQSTIRWAGIQSVAETATHIFVMLNDRQGYVIPKARVETGNVDAFLTEIHRSRPSSGQTSRAPA